jgi:hypothetical protein
MTTAGACSNDAAFGGVSMNGPGGEPNALKRIELSELTDSEDIARVAGQLADLTRKVAKMKGQLEAVLQQAETHLNRADTQQERIDLAARELAEVSERLQAASRALRQSV